MNTYLERVYLLSGSPFCGIKGDKLSEGHLTMGDRIERSRPNKGLHTKGWDQSPIEAQHVIKGLTVENQWVLDPMMGSGTTGKAVFSLQRKFIGIEIDRGEFEIAKANLERALRNLKQ